MEQVTQEEPQDIGVAGRMVRVFYAPGETFGAVSRRHTWVDWFAPVLLIALLSLVATHMTLPIIQQMQVEVLQEKLQDMPEENRQKVMEQAQKASVISAMVMVPVGAFALLFILAGVLLLLTNFIHGGDATYGQMLAVWGYSSLIGIIALIVRVPLMLAKQTMVIHTGPGVLVPEHMLETFLGRLLAGVDLFTFWQVCVLAIGVAAVANFATRKAFVALLVLWVAWVVVKAALGGLVPMFG